MSAARNLEWSDGAAGPVLGGKAGPGVLAWPRGVVLSLVPGPFAAGDWADGEGPWHEQGELAWQDSALCAQTDPEAFFPEKGGSTREAKRTCRACPVRAECLDYALEHDEKFGVWGGLSERERRRFKREAA